MHGPRREQARVLQTLLPLAAQWVDAAAPHQGLDVKPALDSATSLVAHLSKELEVCTLAG